MLIENTNIYNAYVNQLINEELSSNIINKYYNAPHSAWVEYVLSTVHPLNKIVPSNVNIEVEKIGHVMGIDRLPYVYHIYTGSNIAPCA